jgi:hypothetical protein
MQLRGFEFIFAAENRKPILWRELETFLLHKVKNAIV